LVKKLQSRRPARLRKKIHSSQNTRVIRRKTVLTFHFSGWHRRCYKRVANAKRARLKSIHGPRMRVGLADERRPTKTNYEEN